mgnify:CR=1 FL=1
MSFEERARLSQELRAQEMAKAAQMFKDQLGIMFMWTYYGGPMDGETETMHPAMNSTIERRGWRYVCEFATRRLRCVGPA